VAGEPTVAVGRITRPHGVRGEIAVVVLTEVEGRFADGATVWLEDGRPLTIESSRPHRDRLLVRFREVPDRTAAEALGTALLVVPQASSPDLPEGSWWDHELIGCRVVTDTGRDLGELADVIHTTANDVWSAIDATGHETLIPVLRDVLADVDVASKRIVVHEIPGLTAPG
jgi:16S rRNA processing protein RimM